MAGKSGPHLEAQVVELKLVLLVFDGKMWQALKEHELELHPVACGLLTIMDARPSLIREATVVAGLGLK